MGIPEIVAVNGPVEGGMDDEMVVGAVGVVVEGRRGGRHGPVTGVVVENGVKPKAATTDDDGARCREIPVGPSKYIDVICEGK